MKFKVWAERKRKELGNYTKVAAFLGIAQPRLSTLLSGRTCPKLSTLVYIRERTGGAVRTIDDFLPEEPV